MKSQHFTIKRFLFKSSFLDSERTITLAIPKTYQAQTSIKVCLVFDGEELLNNENFNILDHYQGNQIFIGISAVNNLIRFADLTTYHNYQVKPLMEKHFPELSTKSESFLGGNGIMFWQFINQELLPKLCKEYQINVEAYNLIGCSLGAYYCLQLLYLSNLTFNTCYLLSPSIWFEPKILSDLATKPLNQQKSLTINLWVGLKEPHWFEKTIPVDYYQDALAVQKVFSKQSTITLKFETAENGSHGYRWWIPAINQMLLND